MTQKLRAPLLVLVLLTVAWLPVAVSADNSETEGVRIALPAPGVCAKPRNGDPETLPQAFSVTGSPTSRFVATDVAAAGPAASQFQPPAPAPMPIPARVPCDGVGGACSQDVQSPFIEPPPVPGTPPGVPGTP